MFSLSQIFHGWRLRACHSSLPGMTIWKMINSWDEDAKTSEIICEWFDILGWLAQLRTKTFSIKLYLRSYIYIYICWIGQTPEATSVHAGTIRYNDPSMKELDWRFSFASVNEGIARHSKAIHLKVPLSVLVSSPFADMWPILAQGWLCIMGAVPSIVGLVLSYSFLKAPRGLWIFWMKTYFNSQTWP